MFVEGMNRGGLGRRRDVTGVIRRVNYNTTEITVL